MNVGDVVTIRHDRDDEFSGELGLVVGFLDLESYFNPVVVLVQGEQRFYNERDIERVIGEQPALV